MAKRDFVDHCDFVDPVGEFIKDLKKKSGLYLWQLIVSLTAKKRNSYRLLPKNEVLSWMFFQ